MEQGKAVGFELRPVSGLLRLDAAAQALFVPCVYDFASTVIVQKFSGL